MKKLLFVTLFLLSKVAFALPVNNPLAPSLLTNGIFCGQCSDYCDPCVCFWDYLNFRGGFYGDYVFNRHFKVDRHDEGDHLDHSFIATNAAIVIINLYNRFDIFTTLGSSNICLNGNSILFTTDPLAAGMITEIESATEFSWSIGGRATIWRWDCTYLGCEAQYFSTNPNLFRITIADSFAVYPALGDMQYREWQVGIGITQSLAEIAFPYFAVKYSSAHINLDHAQPYGPTGAIVPFTLPNFETSKHVGYVVGLSLVYFDTLNFTVEGRFADEKALHVNAEVRF